MWAKCVAFLLAVVTGLSTLLFGTGALMVGLVPEFQTDEAGYEKLFYGPILETYAASLWENIRQADNPDQMELDGLDGGNIRYVVESQSQYYLDEPQDTYTKLYANDSSVNQEKREETKVIDCYVCSDMHYVLRLSDILLSAGWKKHK